MAEELLTIGRKEQEELSEAIDELIAEALEAKHQSLSQADMDAIAHKVLTRQGAGYVRYRTLRRNRLQKKHAKAAKAKAAKITGALASSLGGSAALGLAAAIAAPTLPAIALSGAVVGLLGGWLFTHRAENQTK